MNANQLQAEIANCTMAIKAFKIGCPWLAPNDLDCAPSIEWLEMQQRACRKQLEAIRNA